MALYIHQTYGPQGVDVTYQDIGNRGLQQQHQIYAEPVIQQHQMYRADPTVQHQIYAEHLIPQHTQIYREEDLQHAQIYRAEDIQQHTQIYREVPQQEAQATAAASAQPATTTTQTHVCDVCNKTCKSKSDLAAHYAGHTGEKAHICDKSTLRTHYLVHSSDRDSKRKKGKGKGKKNGEEENKEPEAQTQIIIAIPEPETIIPEVQEPEQRQERDGDQQVVHIQTEPDHCEMTFAENSGSHEQGIMHGEQQVYLESAQGYATLDQPLTHMVHQALNINTQGLHNIMTVNQQGQLTHLGHQALGQLGHQTLAQIGGQTFTIIGQQPYTTVDQQQMTHIVHSTMANIGDEQNIPPGMPQVFPCNQCQKQFKRKSDLQKHYMVHTASAGRPSPRRAVWPPTTSSTLARSHTVAPTALGASRTRAPCASTSRSTRARRTTSATSARRRSSRRAPCASTR
ncbi:hypothetical protein JTE90_011781 [Oedothorax gibbosus]|uniref:C2H2-type domain-containing protein n=1 Tax=Oedothorax gibbosus TaxID=931172 RepID=A0AAV6VS38_9ARAC|nr:hypothetical protein JTE90_011781 [Oedothorax gibbosus]